MAESRKNPDRKKNVDAFKATQKDQPKQKEKREHLVPMTKWETTDILDLRGDLFEALENQLLETFVNLQQAQEAFQKAAQVMQMIIQHNIKKDKIKLEYQWNNGDPASEQDVAEFQAKLKEIQALREKQYEEVKKQINASKTGLVGANGEPIATTQNLEDNGETAEQPDEGSDEVGPMAD